ncbi:MULTISPECIES: nitrogenase-stabilizing/protective protein NifW [Musicola]|uniref:Nitrogenase-stabilizing/protective protein NifW n=1 Tax=Musicola paradisiaca (strain Ech703) TaxID=579405 RepID=C6C8U6_MUSP7|nr:MULTISPECIES: nitrogenase-stabilizing/protective protein NifW [Musicola]ACS84317.1 nitrogenase stabilizing/protective protein [Musicola paradisiaca Ech703]
MEWFYRLPGVSSLDSAEAFFTFFSVPYDPATLSARCLPVLSEFHRRLRTAVPLRNSLECDTNADWQLARRLLAESYRSLTAEAAS